MPEEWREYRALQTGTVAPQPYDEQPWQRTSLFIAFAGLEHDARLRAEARRNARR